MKPNLAIVIKGQVREWEKAKHSILSFGKKQEKYFNVVYFFVSWDTSYTPLYFSENMTSEPVKFSERIISDEEAKSIISDFAGTTLGKFHLIDTKKANKELKKLKFNEEYEKILYLRHTASMIRQNYEIENDLSFHTVINLRPDVFIVSLPEQSFSPPASLPPFSISTLSPYESRADSLVFESAVKQTNCLFAEDIILMFDSFTADIVESEFHFLTKSSFLRSLITMIPHHLFCDHLLNMKLINVCNISSVITGYAIIRPSSFFLGPVDFTDISDATCKNINIANGIFQNTKERLTNHENTQRP